MPSPFFHLGTALTAAGVLTVSNPNNIASGERFVLALALNPDSIITGTPVNYTVTINGVAVKMVNIFGAQISTDKLIPRIPYRGYYFVPTDGEDPYVVLNTYCSPCQSQSSAVAAGG